MSPFNARSGFYDFSIILPFDHAPSRSSGTPPHGRVRVDPFTESASDADELAMDYYNCVIDNEDTSSKP